MENRLHLHHSFAPQNSAEARIIFDNMDIMDKVPPPEKAPDAPKPATEATAAEKAAEATAAAGGILAVKESLEERESAEDIEKKLDLALKRARDAIQSPMTELPIGQMLTSRDTDFETVTAESVQNKGGVAAGKDKDEKTVVMNTKAIDAVKKIGQGIGYDISKLKDDKNGLLERKDGRQVEIKGGIAKIELEEFMPTGSTDLKTQAEAVEKCIDSWTLQLGTNIDASIVLDQYDEKKGKEAKDGGFEFTMEKEEWKSDDANAKAAQEQIAAFLTSLEKPLTDIEESAQSFESTVSGRFLKSAQVKLNSKGEMLLCAKPEMEQEFKQFHIAWSLWGMGERLPVRERTDADTGDTVLERGMVITPNKLQNYLDNMQLRLTGDVREGAKVNGGLIGSAGIIAISQELVKGLEKLEKDGEVELIGQPAVDFVNTFRANGSKLEGKFDEKFPLKIVIKRTADGTKEPTVTIKGVDTNLQKDIGEFTVKKVPIEGAPNVKFEFVGEKQKAKEGYEILMKWVDARMPKKPSDVKIIERNFELEIPGNISYKKIELDAKATKKVVEYMAGILGREIKAPEGLKATIAPADGLEDGNLTIAFSTARSERIMEPIPCKIENEKIKFNQDELEEAVAVLERF